MVIILVGEPTSFMDAYAFIKALNLEKGIKNVSVIVNLASGKKDAETSFERFEAICKKFLIVDLVFLGWLPESKIISKSILARKPYAINKNIDRNLSTRIEEIVQNMMVLKPFYSNNIRFFND